MTDINDAQLIALQRAAGRAADELKQARYEEQLASETAALWAAKLEDATKNREAMQTQYDELAMFDTRDE